MDAGSAAVVERPLAAFDAKDIDATGAVDAKDIDAMRAVLVPRRIAEVTKGDGC